MVIFFKPELELTLKTLKHINRLISVLNFFSDGINPLEKNVYIFSLFVLAKNTRANIQKLTCACAIFTSILDMPKWLVFSIARRMIFVNVLGRLESGFDLQGLVPLPTFDHVFKRLLA